MKNLKSEKFKEGIDEISPSLKLDIPDEELVNNINKLISSGEKIKNDIQKETKINEKYWKGNQLDETKLPPATMADSFPNPIKIKSVAREALTASQPNCRSPIKRPGINMPPTVPYVEEPTT